MLRYTDGQTYGAHYDSGDNAKEREWLQILFQTMQTWGALPSDDRSLYQAQGVHVLQLGSHRQSSAWQLTYRVLTYAWLSAVGRGTAHTQRMC